VGFVMSLDGDDAEKLMKDTNLECDLIGYVVPGRDNVKIESHFSGKEIKY